MLSNIHSSGSLLLHNKKAAIHLIICSGRSYSCNFSNNRQWLIMSNALLKSSITNCELMIKITCYNNTAFWMAAYHSVDTCYYWSGICKNTVCCVKYMHASIMQVHCLGIYSLNHVYVTHTMLLMYYTFRQSSVVRPFFHCLDISRLN